jgi:hypothetical protein
MGQVLPKTSPEQRHRFYEDVETLINTGFLSISFSVNGVSLALRSLGPGDSFLLRSRIVSDTAYEWKVWTIASSIWLLDGYNILDEPNVTPRLARMVKTLPATAKDILFELAMGLYERQSKALEAVETYCYENMSRYRWKTFGGHFYGSHSGIPGVERIGSNNVQRIWTFFNETEDLRLQESNQWEGFKLVASAQAPKGVKKIDERDRSMRQTEVERRQASLDKFYYVRMGVISPEKNSEDKPVLITASKSADELADEMFRWVTGQEDWHDKIVFEYKRDLTERYEQEQQDRARRAAWVRAHQEEDSDRPINLVGYTPEQLAQILKDRKMAPGVRQVSDESELYQQKYYNTYLREGGIDSGALAAADDGKLDIRQPLDLTEQVSQRNVVFTNQKR